MTRFSWIEMLRAESIATRDAMTAGEENTNDGKLNGLSISVRGMHVVSANGGWITVNFL